MFKEMIGLFVLMLIVISGFVCLAAEMNSLWN